MADNVHDLQAQRFVPHQTAAAQKSRTSDKKVSRVRDHRQKCFLRSIR